MAVAAQTTVGAAELRELGYRSSDLAAWVRERAGTDATVTTISDAALATSRASAHGSRPDAGPRISRAIADAIVLGQLFPGQVSVWEPGEGSLRRGLKYIVSPGNVGDEQALAQALDRLEGAA
jgi:hypothetical protein